MISLNTYAIRRCSFTVIVIVIILRNLQDGNWKPFPLMRNGRESLGYAWEGSEADSQQKWPLQLWNIWSVVDRNKDFLNTEISWVEHRMLKITSKLGHQQKGKGWEETKQWWVDMILSLFLFPLHFLLSPKQRILS